MSTFHIKTFGCKVNQYDGRKLAEYLQEKGYIQVSLQEAQAIVVNGCSVTARSEQKIRQFIRSRQKETPGKKIVITGCYANRMFLSGEEPPDKIYFAPENNHKIWDDLFPFLPDKKSSEQFLLRDRTRAFIKIQDGCRQFCSYCIVPYVRGSNQSRKPDKIYDELERASQQGIQEIVLSGVHVGQYGQDLSEGLSLTQLMKGIRKRFSFERIRLSSIEVTEITSELIELIKSSPFCRHLHIPLQSGSDHILAGMNRSYRREDFLSLVKKIRDSVPLIGISTDIIAGFPGESMEDFEQTRDILHQIPFVKVHVFPYSSRPFTAAASFGNKVPPSQIKERASILREDASASNFSFYSSMEGKKLLVLNEKYSRGFIHGYSDNYLKIETPVAQPLNHNTIVEVKGIQVRQTLKETTLISDFIGQKKKTGFSK